MVDIKGRAARFAQRLFDHLRCSRARARPLNRRSSRNAVRAQHRARILARGETQRDRHQRRFLALGKAARGLVVQRLHLVQRHVGFGAEHCVALFAGVIAIGKAVARKDTPQRVAFLGRGVSMLAQQIRVNLRHDRGVFRPLHAPFDLE